VLASATRRAREGQDIVHLEIGEPGAPPPRCVREAAIAALDGGELPSSSGEKQMLRLAASLAGQAPVCLGDAVTGTDHRNVGLLVKAVRHASGQRQSR